MLRACRSLLVTMACIAHLALASHCPGTVLPDGYPLTVPFCDGTVGYCKYRCCRYVLTEFGTSSAFLKQSRTLCAVNAFAEPPFLTNRASETIQTTGLVCLCSGHLCIPCGCTANSLGLSAVCGAIMQASSDAGFCMGVFKAYNQSKGRMSLCARDFVDKIFNNFGCCAPLSYSNHKCAHTFSFRQHASLQP